MTSATERLRAMLDDRGVEWWQSANTLGCIFTRWHSPLFGDEVCAMENGEEGLVLFDHFLTPEQAIAATLGSPVDAFTLDEIEDLYEDLCDSCNDVIAIVDGVRYETDWGYGEEGVRYFIDMLRRRHGIEGNA